MDIHLSHLDLETLKKIYDHETSELNAKLLNGAEWREVMEHKTRITELAMVIHRRHQSLRAKDAPDPPGEQA